MWQKKKKKQLKNVTVHLFPVGWFQFRASYSACVCGSTKFKNQNCWVSGAQKDAGQGNFKKIPRNCLVSNVLNRILYLDRTALWERDFFFFFLMSSIKLFKQFHTSLVPILIFIRRPMEEATSRQYLSPETNVIEKWYLTSLSFMFWGWLWFFKHELWMGKWGTSLLAWEYTLLIQPTENFLSYLSLIFTLTSSFLSHFRCW